MPIDTFVKLVFAIRWPSSRDLVLRDRDRLVYNKIPSETDKRDFDKRTTNVCIVMHIAGKWNSQRWV